MCLLVVLVSFVGQLELATPNLPPRHLATSPRHLIATSSHLGWVIRSSIRSCILHVPGEHDNDNSPPALIQPIRAACFSVQIVSLVGCSHNPPRSLALPRATTTLTAKNMFPRQDRFIYVAGASLVAIARSVEAKSKSSQKTSKPASTSGGGGSTCYDDKCVHPTSFP